jgi:four helix bundle protein
LLKVAVENSEKIFCRFLYIGSAIELEYQILLSIDLKFIDNENGQKLLFQIEEVKNAKRINCLSQAAKC